MSVLFTDIEVYRNFFYVGIKRQHDGRRIGFEMSRRSTLDRDRLRTIMMRNTIITYNGLGYDVPLIFYALEDGVTTSQIKDHSDAIINGRLRWFDVEKLTGVRVPRRCDHIDLKEPQPNGDQVKPGESGGSAFTPLKLLNGRVHGHRLQDLPFEPDTILTPEQMDITADYCLNSDTDATENLYVALKEPLALRVALGAEYDDDFRSKSDSQIGEAIVKKRIKALTGEDAQKAPTPPGTMFQYPVPAFLKFERPDLREVLERIRETRFVVNDKGKVELPKWLSETKIKIGSSIYSMGIGGLHSTESCRAVHSDEDYVLVDADVASQYPSIILALGLVPKALGKHFLTVYRKIKDDRLAAKKRAKAIKELLKGELDVGEKARLEAEMSACTVKDKGLKIALNGVYGKLGSKWSILYAPHLLVSTTLTGQLTLLMLIEKAERAGIDVVSGNTDGVLFRCPRELYDGLEGDRLAPSALADVCAEWERETGFDLEFAEYRSIFNRDVNNYIALKSDGGHKRKGVFLNPWSADKDDKDPRALLMKNPTATICSDAVLAFVKHGTPIEDTIRACTDIRQFVSVIKADGGATWRDQYLGKVVRFYWSTDGEELVKVRAHKATGNRPKVPRTEGAAPCMTLPEGLPDDLDYDRYIYETRQMLMNCGAIYKPPPPFKMIRFNKDNRAPILSLWALVDY